MISDIEKFVSGKIIFKILPRSNGVMLDTIDIMTKHNI